MTAAIDLQQVWSKYDRRFHRMWRLSDPKKQETQFKKFIPNLFYSLKHAFDNYAKHVPRSDHEDISSFLSFLFNNAPVVRFRILLVFHRSNNGSIVHWLFLMSRIRQYRGHRGHHTAHHSSDVMHQLQSWDEIDLVSDYSNRDLNPEVNTL